MIEEQEEEVKEFSSLTRKLTKKLTKNEKKKEGIFITPYSIIKKIVDRVFFFGKWTSSISILEPTCGTCEIISYIDRTVKTNVCIDGVEKNDTIFSHIKDLFFTKKVSLFHEDFLTFRGKKSYDVIVGNPPYVVCTKSLVPERFLPLFSGRPNLFCIILLLSIEKLNKNGILGFVLPQTFFHSSSYSHIRKYIVDTCTILDILDFGKDDNYIETSQKTFGLIITRNNVDEEKKSDGGLFKSRYLYYIEETSNYIFTIDSSILFNLFKDSTTIKNMGLSVKTGTIVWNENKDKLVSSSSDGIVLLYNTNLTNENSIELKNNMSGGKQQYIDIENVECFCDLVLVVNRGNGNSKYKLKYALVDLSTPFLVENHLNVIYSKNIKGNNLRDLFKIIIKSFNSKKTKEFTQHFLTNGSLSKTELETIFPIYI